MVSSSPSKRKREGDHTNSNLFPSTKHQKIEQKRSAIAECPRQSRKQTLITKSNTCKNNSQNTESSKILEVGSTLSDPDCKPYWGLQSKVASKNLWLPQETDSLDLESNSSYGSSKNNKSKSWFYQNQKTKKLPQKNEWYKTFLQSYMSSIARCKEEDDTKEKEKGLNKLARTRNGFVRTVKFQLDPKQWQKEILNRWIGTSRFVYNQTVKAVENKEIKPSVKEVKKYTTSDDMYSKHPWLKEVPYNLRGDASIEAAAAYKTNFKKLAKGSQTHFKIRYRKKSVQKQTIKIQKQNISLPSKKRTRTGKIKLTKGTVLFRRLKNKYPSLVSRQAADGVNDWNMTLEDMVVGRFSKKNKLPPIEGSISITKEHYKFYVCIPYIVPQKKRVHSNVVALDPGDRKFLTYWSPDGHYGTIGNHATRDRIRSLCERLDSTVSCFDNLKKHNKIPFNEFKSLNLSKKCMRQRLKRKKSRLIMRIKNLVKELHHKASLYLVRHYKYILLPTFETSVMSQRLHSKVARSMLTFSHYKFKMLLKSKAEVYGCHVLDVNEAYTSKTCGLCGHRTNVGKKEVYKCGSCGYTVDRDMNGARNVFIRFLSIYGKISPFFAGMPPLGTLNVGARTGLSSLLDITG